MKEEKRQLVHILVSIVLILILYFLGRTDSIAALFLILIVGAILINLRMRDKVIPILDSIEKHLERKNVRFPGYGSAWYMVGALLATTFLQDISQIAAIIWILGTGDGFSTLVGKLGTHKLIYNPKKTVEGSIAFVIASLPAYFFIGLYIVPLSITCAIVESLPIDVEDNITIPIVAIVLLGIL